MTSGLAKPSSVEESLHAAICVLSLISPRSKVVDELVPHESSNGQSNENISTESPLARANLCTVVPDGAAHDSEVAAEDENDDDIDVAVDEGVEEPSHLLELRDRVLDRLAETLARFKSDPRDTRKPPLDSKHVCSTMMVEYPTSEAVKFLCAKNEGLDQGNTTEDTDFLDAWRRCMECISKRDPKAEHAKESLFMLVIEHQRPRIVFFTQKLRAAFAAAKDSTASSQSNGNKLSEGNLSKLPAIGSRKWIDDQDNEFKIGAKKSPGNDAESDTAATGDSFTDITAEVDVIFDNIDKLCQSGVANIAVATPFTTSQGSLLRKLMTASLEGWKSVRHRSVITTRLSSLFENVKQGAKWERVATTALKFLARVYLAVSTFIEAAENMPTFRSVECVSVQVPSVRRVRYKSSRETPLEAIERLGISVTVTGWNNHLQKGTTKDLFYKLRRQKRHIHAELQVLHHHDAFYAATDASRVVHPYIGCSKRCCFLCYTFVRAHGRFRVRGTHETILPRWEIPVAPSSSFYPNIQSATMLVFRIIISILREAFQQSYRPDNGELLAQSSAAMSTAQTVLDRELGNMEKSHHNTRQMMMMPMVANDGVLVTPIPDSPGRAHVIGGSMGTRGREMSLTEAELYKDNHIRIKLELDDQEGMPPRKELTLRSCRTCQKPASFRCSTCRMSYCCTSCQRKDWKRHVFVCAVRNRPNDFDRLRMFLVQRVRIQQDEIARSQFLMDLFSDDHLCRAFGFVNCVHYDDVARLLCIYDCMIKTFKPCIINSLGLASLGRFLDVWMRLSRMQANDAPFRCHWIPWFLEQRAAGFDIPNWDRPYLYQNWGIIETQELFCLENLARDKVTLLPSEKAVASLYFGLFRDFNNIPDACSSEWIEFGFCFCRSNEQKKALADAYLDLAKRGASLSEIARAWQASSLVQLMTERGIDMSSLSANGVRLERPGPDETGVYRLMAEVEHALSGVFCHCFRVRPDARCHAKYEAQLSVESDGDYGFHGTSAYERWQLLNFWRHTFRQPAFDARRMLRARRHPDPDALERYVDSLVPDFRFRVGDLRLRDAFFPRLRSRVRFPHGRLRCYCVVHKVLRPDGLDWTVLWGIRHALDRASDDDDDVVDDGMGDGQRAWLAGGSPGGECHTPNFENVSMSPIP